jgi:hypothetical protein
MKEIPGGTRRLGSAVTESRGWLAIGLGLLVGFVTSLAQGRPPGALDAFTNSASAWLVVAFVVGCLVRSLPHALVAGAATCVAELVGYYLTASARGLGLGGSSMLALWVTCAVVGGPVLAAAGSGGATARFPSATALRWCWRRALRSRACGMPSC